VANSRNMKRYRRVLAEVRAERGEYCELCGTPSKYIHHIIAVGDTGIDDELVYTKENMIILCDDCHLLMHPGIRNTEWMTVRRVRGRAILQN
jgi:predicted HNH restriction endonuclease